MSAQELKAKAAAEILMFEKLSKLTAVSMVKMLMSQEDKIAELEKALRDIEHAVHNKNELLEMQKNQDIRDLEQQFKGVQILLGFSFEMNSPASGWVDVIYLYDVEKTILSLFNKAKALKEDK
jgi:hypothetical protein